MKYIKTLKLVFLILTIGSFSSFSQVVLNGQIDSVDEMVKKETFYIPMSDGTLLATDISLPIFQDSVVIPLEIGGQTYDIQLIPRNSQYIIYDTTNISPESYRLPMIFTRTPYNKDTDNVGGQVFPFLGYGYAIQDMRGRYDSEGVYFPMYSDSWPKLDYHPEITIPMDVTSLSDANNALRHRDGSESIYYLADSVYRITDVNLDGIMDTILISNGKIGMFGASALGNSQLQAISDMPYTVDSPIECLVPIVATNEHYNTTLFHNGVYRHALVTGWITGQITDGVWDTLNVVDNSILNNLHSPADYNYSNTADLANDLIDWFVADKPSSTSPSGAHPTSKLRMDLDASMAPVDMNGMADVNGNVSRYKNLNKPNYHVTGWWDIFINGQIETYRKTREANPDVVQKLMIGPWTHQTIGTPEVGDVVFPDNVNDIIGINFDIDLDNLDTTNIVAAIFKSELLAWYRKHLGGEPFFIIPESEVWQDLGANSVRVPAKNYILPYHQFLNYIGGVAPLPDLPVELKTGGNIIPLNINAPMIDDPLIVLDEPLAAVNTDALGDYSSIKMYITGPTGAFIGMGGVGNYWYEAASLPLESGVQDTVLYLHQNKTLTNEPPTQHEGTLSYIADPNNPVITIGGNNMIPDVPGGGRKSQGPMDLANPDFIDLTMNRSDVLEFITESLTDTLSVVGFPKAGIYAKGKTDTYDTEKTDFDVMVRVLDVYPNGKEMLITEGVVNAKSREYALSIYDADTNENVILSNINNDEYYYFKFDLLPLGHTFNKNHKIKILISSSNYPKYQSNPHIPNEDGEFFRWTPGSNKTYDYYGETLSAQNAEITYDFNVDYPSFISLPVLVDPENNVSIAEEKKNSAPNVLVYPNPTKSQITVSLPEIYSGDVNLFDLSGQRILMKEVNNTQKFTWNLEDVKQGVYLLQLPGINVTKKVIVQ